MGGGGLFVGMVVYIKFLCFDIKVIGVEVDESVCLKVVFEVGKFVEFDCVGSFVDGVVVKIIGIEIFCLV